MLLRRQKNKKSIDLPWSNIDQVLPQVLHSIQRIKKTRPKNIDTVWRLCADPAFVTYTRCEQFVSGTLYVKVFSTAVYSELVMQGTEELVAKLCKHQGFSSLKAVVYRR